MAGPERALCRTLNRPGDPHHRPIRVPFDRGCQGLSTEPLECPGTCRPTTDADRHDGRSDHRPCARRSLDDNAGAHVIVERPLDAPPRLGHAQSATTGFHRRRRSDSAPGSRPRRRDQVASVGCKPRRSRGRPAGRFHLQTNRSPQRTVQCPAGRASDWSTMTAAITSAAPRGGPDPTEQIGEELVREQLTPMRGQEREHARPAGQMHGDRLHIQNLALSLGPSLHSKSIATSQSTGRGRPTTAASSDGDGEVAVVTDLLDLDVLTGVGRIDHVAGAEVHADVVQLGAEQDEVPGQQLARRDAHALVDLVAGVVVQGDAGVAPGPQRQA